MTIKKVYFLFLVIILISLYAILDLTPEITVTAFSKFPVPSEIHIQTTSIRNAVQIRYENISYYVDTMQANGTLSDEEIGKTILAAIEGKSISETLPSEYLLEALTYREVIQTITYLKISRDGSFEYLSESDIKASLLQENSLWKRLFSCGDSYYQITVTAAEVPAPDDRYDEQKRYFVLSARIRTLKEDLFIRYDTNVLGITWMNSVFDDQYAEYAMSVWKNENSLVFDSKQYAEDTKICDAETSQSRLSLTYDYGVRCEAAAQSSAFRSDSVVEQYMRTRIFTESENIEVQAYYTMENHNLLNEVIEPGGLRFGISTKPLPVYKEISVKIP